jgi:hypothetical protein
VQNLADYGRVAKLNTNFGFIIKEKFKFGANHALIEDQTDLVNGA